LVPAQVDRLSAQTSVGDRKVWAEPRWKPETALWVAITIKEVSTTSPYLTLRRKTVRAL
jgi:hypothetical protein